MQAENTKNNIKTITFGCRLNTLESEKIQNLLSAAVSRAILVNTCAVTGEAERQSGQAVRKLARENPDTPIFVTGCAATRNPDLFAKIPHTYVIPNADKMKIAVYLDAAGLPHPATDFDGVPMARANGGLSKQFIQIQNGCNHDCTYCVTRLLRGPAMSFEYDLILSEVKNAVAAGFGEIVFTGVDIASYARVCDGKPFLISDLCQRILADVPGVRRLRLSSMDPASPEIMRVIDLMHREPRMMRHLHLSMQSGSDPILAAMRRRHTADTVRKIAATDTGITLSWDIICGFPGETDELFEQTLQLVRETRPIKIHAFPFSPRPGTVAAEMPNQVNRAVAKSRVKIISDLAECNRRAYMSSQLGQHVPVLVEKDNIARTQDDIAVRIDGAPIAPRTICDVILTDVNADGFIGKIA